MSFQEISLNDPIPTYGTINDERGIKEVLVQLEPDIKISELAKKIFGDYYEQIFTKIKAYNIALFDLKNQKGALEKSWTYWVYKNNIYLRAGQATVSGASSFGLVINSIVQKETTVVEGIFIAASLGLTVLSVIDWKPSLPAFLCLKWDKVGDELNKLNESIAQAEHNQKACANLNELAVRMAEFISVWQLFEKNSHEGRIAELFSLLEKIEIQCDVYNKTCFELDIENFYKRSSQYIDKNFYLQKGLNRLNLMDQICEKLKKGKIFTAWSSLKKSTSNNFLLLASDAEPWKSLGIANPDKSSYISFFASFPELKKVTLAEQLEQHFANFFS